MACQLTFQTDTKCRANDRFDRNERFCYALGVQTTLRIDDQLYRDAKAEAARLGVTLTRFIEDALRERIAHRKGTEALFQAEIAERQKLMESLLQATAHFRVGGRPTREEMNAR